MRNIEIQIKIKIRCTISIARAKITNQAFEKKEVSYLLKFFLILFPEHQKAGLKKMQNEEKHNNKTIIKR